VFIVRTVAIIVGFTIAFIATLHFVQIRLR